MSICIVAATSLELNDFKDENIQTLIAGIGAASTTYHLMRYLRDNKPSLLIQAGIAGSFSESFPPRSAVVVSADRFADLGVHETNQWKDIFDLQLADPAMPPFTDGWLQNPNDQLLNSLQLPKVKSITINEITTAPIRIKQLKAKYDPIIESMEGAAFHYVCLLEKIPFIQLRTMSNYIGERNKEKWAMKQAIQNLAEHLRAIIKQVQ